MMDIKQYVKPKTIYLWDKSLINCRTPVLNDVYYKEIQEKILKDKSNINIQWMNIKYLSPKCAKLKKLITICDILDIKGEQDLLKLCIGKLYGNLTRFRENTDEIELNLIHMAVLKKMVLNIVEKIRPTVIHLLINSMYINKQVNEIEVKNTIGADNFIYKNTKKINGYLEIKISDCSNSKFLDKKMLNTIELINYIVKKYNDSQ